MDHSVHNKIVSFIWSIADDCLRDVFVRGRYQHKPLRSLEEVTAEILALEAETDGLLKQLVSFVGGKAC